MHSAPVCATALICLTVLTGCPGVPKPPPIQSRQTDSGTELRIDADWEDVDRSVRTGASHAEMAVLGAIAEPDRQVFELRTVAGEAGEVTIVRLSPGAAGEPAQLRLTARIGPFGNPGAEQRLLAFIAKRLQQLRGVEWAPL